MCLILFSWKNTPGYKLVVAANREEYRSRPTQSLHWWDDFPLLGGRDLKSQGTWMAVNKSGEFSAVTNIKSTTPKNPEFKSRGLLPVEYLTGQEIRGRYNPVNLLTTQGNHMFHTNDSLYTLEVMPGTHALGNGGLDEPDPKLNLGKKLFENAQTVGDYFTLLADPAIIVQDDTYGTVSSTVLRIRYNGEFEFIERCFSTTQMLNQTIINGNFSN